MQPLFLLYGFRIKSWPLRICILKLNKMRLSNSGILCNFRLSRNNNFGKAKHSTRPYSGKHCIGRCWVYSMVLARPGF